VSSMRSFLDFLLDTNTVMNLTCEAGGRRAL
jgi:hypothetical protein